MKSTILICVVLYALEAEAMPSVGTKTFTVEELNNLIQVNMARTLKDMLTATTTLAPGLISKEKSESVEPPWQLSAAQNLTKSIEELVKSIENVPSLPTPAPASSANVERFKSIEQDIKSHSESIKKLTTAVEKLAGTSPNTLCGPDSGYKYWPVTKSCYKLHDESLSWSAADKACLSEGAYLAVINSHNEAQYLLDISQYLTNIFVGVFRDRAEQWMTVTGGTVESAAGYHPWSKAEPFTDDILWRFASLSHSGYLISRTANSTYPFVCENVPSLAQIVL